ncbi:MAG: hypothetical protein ACFFC7_20580 [Candidatus Hermodarchaeota archaeon]
MSLPTELLEQLIQNIQKTYPSASRDELIPIINQITLKDAEFIKLLKTKTVKDISRTRIYRNVLKKIKRQLYYQRRTFTREIDAPRAEFLRKLCKETSLYSLRSIELHKKLLQTHTSTQNRISHYFDLYKEIFAITGVPNSILDLGCGINYLSMPFLLQASTSWSPKLLYLGVEKKNDEVDLGKEYLKCINAHIDPKSDISHQDILQIIKEERSNIFENTYDLCFLFRMLPLLERHQKNATTALLSKIRAKWLIVSISLKSLAKEQDISAKQRTLILKLLDHSYLKIIKRLFLPQEEFYIIKLQISD